MMLLNAAILLAMGDMYDVIDEVAAFLTPPECPSGCINWTAALNASEQAKTFADPSFLPSLGARCAIPGRALHQSFGQAGRVFNLSAIEQAAFYGPICPCRTSATSAAVEFHTCTAPLFVPEQINLQLANSTTVVVSFVSHELSPPTKPPVARLGLASEGGPPSATLSGVSHWYQTSHVNGSAACHGPEPGDPSAALKCNARNITMHFIRFPSLEPRQKYVYQVRSGGNSRPSAWSQVYTFRAPYGHGSAAKSGGSNATRVAIYGDMGNVAGNNMGNLRAGCESGTIDAVVHMGDHCYNMGNGNDYHGDAYMQAFQGALAVCPWLPMIGNHESTLGSEHNIDESTQERYLNETWGVIYGQDGAETETGTAQTTATTSLGHLITRSSFYAAASHGAAPSRTSQWYSVDLGLIHFVILDLNPGPPAVFAGAQFAWAAADLAAADANRANVPWIVVTSHYPLYSAEFYDPELEHASAMWYDSEVAEHERSGDGTPWSATPHFEACAEGNATCATVKDIVGDSIRDLGALLDKYHVDIYAAGHIHSYSVTWPILGGAPTNASFEDPKGTVHVVEGNGGVPGAHTRTELFPCSKISPHSPPASLSVFRMCGWGMNYGRLVTTNASVLTYEHVANYQDRVTDSWSIVRTH